MKTAVDWETLVSFFYVLCVAHSAFVSFACLSLMFWNSSLSIWLSVPEEALIVPSLSVSQFSVPHHVPGEQRESTPGMTMAFHCRTEDATFKGWKAPSIYVHIPAENEEKDLVICFLTGIFDDFLVLGWFHATRKHRGVDFTYWGFFQVNGAFHVCMDKVRDYGSIYGLDSERWHTQSLLQQKSIK